MVSRRQWLIACGVASVVLVGAVVLRARDDGSLPRSPTCGAVERPPLRLRSVPPSPPSSLPPSSPSGAEDEAVPADPAFRPGGAQPVYCADFADPFVLGRDVLLGSRLFAYATGTADAKVPVLSSATGLRSDALGDALAELPAWSEPGGVWAPSVLARGDDLVLYYTTTDRASGRQCISVASGRDPEGPFVDGSAAPLLCPQDLGGAIDPSAFVGVDGRAHLLWKNDGNCCGVPTRLWSSPLSADGLAIAGQPTELLRPSQAWEGSVVEAPAMVEHRGGHYLFYSANAWDTGAYAIGYATCAGPVGPCEKPLDGPWLASSDDAVGPGGQELFQDGSGRLRIVFHAWAREAVGYERGGFRSLFSAGVDFVGDAPVTVD